ncbi:MAG: phosphate ABC transporter permease PstA [Pseudomonadota bacterium]
MVDMKALSDYHTSDAAKKFMRKRHRSEARFKALGVIAILLALGALVSLAWTIGSNAVRALYEYDVTVDISFPQDAFDRSTAVKDFERPLIEQGILSEDSIIRREFRNQTRVAIEKTFLAQFDGVPEDRRGNVLELLSRGSIDTLSDAVLEGTYGPGDVVQDFPALLSDDAQLYYKGGFGLVDFVDTAGILDLVDKGDGRVDLLAAANDFSEPFALVKEALLDQALIVERDARRQAAAVGTMQGILEDAGLSEEERTEAENALNRFVREEERLTNLATSLRQRANAPGGREELSEDLPSVLVFVNGGTIKIDEFNGANQLTGTILRPLSAMAQAPAGEWRIGMLEGSENSRRIKDQDVVWLEELREKGLVISKPNWPFLLEGDSREAELAGVWGGIVGSFWTMIVTFAIAFPIGVMAAIYLEEFAQKNSFTDFIEVNINNLAAIPSIIFGLFGLLLLLSGFKVPFFGGEIEIGGWAKEFRSAAFVGGIVLALMTLPTIIIAARASVRAVPPSIRDAALGLGASKVQTVFHHVLPLAMPGIMTGTIIGMAQALGETAPLLMVGMVGFFADVSTGVADPTTVMPALVYFWSDYPEKLFELKTSLAIVVLLLFLIAMNTLAIILRKRFERRW